MEKEVIYLESRGAILHLYMIHHIEVVNRLLEREQKIDNSNSGRYACEICNNKCPALRKLVKVGRFRYFGLTISKRTIVL